MPIRTSKPVSAGLGQVAEMDPRDRSRIVRQLCRQYPAFRRSLTQISIARSAAFGATVALAVAVFLLANGASVWWSAVLVLVGLGAFGYSVVVLSDSRFDLILAVVGAHRTDELLGQLRDESLYGPESTEEAVAGTPSPDPRTPGSARAGGTEREAGGGTGACWVHREGIIEQVPRSSTTARSTSGV